jgi:hypothetical protein
MKLNAKDIASGVLLLLVAVVGLWLNYQDHTLGTPRRMGPGYMPMLVFWLQIGLALLVLVIAFTNGPDPLERWSGVDTASIVGGIVVGTLAYWLAPSILPFFGQTYNAIGVGMLVGFLVICFAEGWRLLGFILAAMCIFSLLLEKGGLMLSILGTVVISALAEPEHRQRPIGVAGAAIFLMALCWWIFIDQLDIRVAVWPQF